MENEMETPVVIGRQEVKKAMETLKKYKSGKKALEEKIVKNEEWWKIRHWDRVKQEGDEDEPKPASGWLFNCIMSKHADCMDSYPSASILPREAGDTEEAKKLSSIIPVILEQNEFEEIYSEETMYKLKNGTGCYGVFWDQSKLNGLGDIAIRSVDLLHLYWEPGIKDIQQSRNVFNVEMVDNEALEELYPELKGKLKEGRDDDVIRKYLLDDSADTTGKSVVVDWYYKKNVGGKQVLHFCKFVRDIVLYATENDTEQPMTEKMDPVLDETGQQVIDEEGLPVLQPVQVPEGEAKSVEGWYDHGQYPFVFDVMFKEEGTPVGFGFVDVCKNAQMSIDLMNNALEKNAVWNATPRYFSKIDGSVNEEEFLDMKKPIVHVSGNLGDDSLKPITATALNGNYISILNNKIDEMKETAGNRDVANGGTTSGATAASAIAAMQEQSGKTSRDMIRTTYRAYSKVVYLVIELIRQFYDLPRQFRIIGESGQEEFAIYDNENLKAQSQGTDFGEDMGYRLPVFDVKVAPQKESAYSQLSQNELALQFYNSGFFNPEYADQVLACLDMMEFQGKDKMIQKVQANGGMYQQMLMMQQQMLQMSQMIDQLTGQTNLAENMAEGITGQSAAPKVQQVKGTNTGKENAVVANARERAQAATTPR